MIVFGVHSMQIDAVDDEHFPLRAQSLKIHPYPAPGL